MEKGIINNFLYILKKTWKYEKRTIFSIIIQIILGVVVPIADVILPALVIGSIEYGLNSSMVVIIFCILLFILGINILSTYLNNMYGLYILNNKIGFLSELFRKKMKMDYSYIESPEGQTAYENAFISILNDYTGVSGMLMIVGPLFSSFIGICINIGIMCKLSIYVVIMLLFTSLVHIYIAYLVRIKQGKMKEEIADNSRRMSYLFSFISNPRGAREIRIFNMYEWMKKTIEREIRDRIYLAKKSNGYMFYLSVADCLILAFRDAVAYIIVISAILHGEINIWELIMYLGTTTCTSAFFSDLTSNIALMELRSVEINVIRNFLDKEIGSRRDKFFLANDINLEIEFKDVSFKFQENGEYILRHVNLKIDTNSKIAIVGENGAGKSTLIKLICGLYVPTEGKILVNGIDLKK